MNIKKKILISNVTMVVLAILMAVLSTIVILNQGVDQLSKTLLDELRAATFQRVRSGNGLLQRLLTDYLLNFKQATKKFCHNRVVSEGISKGQWKAIFSQADMACKNAGIDFLVVFDKQGKDLVNWPSWFDAGYTQRHFRTLRPASKFEEYVENGDLADVPVYAFFERWNRQAFGEYGVDIGDGTGLVVLCIGIIPNAYFDEPVGYVLMGVTSDRLQSTLTEFSRTTGHVSVLIDGQMPLVWEGLSLSKKELKKQIPSFSSGPDGKIHVKDYDFGVDHDGSSYYIFGSQLSLLAGPSTNVAPSAQEILIIAGEPTSSLLKTTRQIQQVSNRTLGSIFQTVLLIGSIILVMTILLVNMVAKKISEPIKAAANISDKIASGDLDHVLDASRPDETGRLFKSMNQMILKLKYLREQNRKQLQRIRESKDRIASILAAIQEGVILIDAATCRIIDVNPAAASMIDAARDDIIDTEYTRYTRKIEAELLGRKGSPLSFTDEFLNTAEGDRIPVLMTAVHITIEKRECLLISFIDITPLKLVQEERQQLESKLQRARKMESLGTLAGGVAHDLNNILSGIVSYPDLILLDIDEDSPLRKPLLNIKKSGMRASAIVQDLLTLARRNVVTKKVINLNKLINDFLVTPECRKITGDRSNITIQTNLGNGLTTVLGSETHLSKAVMNLISNAVDAMPAGGLITIATLVRYLDQPHEGHETIPKGEYAVLQIGDTGIGMPQSDLDKIFEPFYTKKVLGQSGTGLGMSVVWGTVKDHDGYIDIETREGTGTTFTLYFPISRTVPLEAPKIRIDDYLGNGESILIVDDAAEQRVLASRMMERLGYVVFTASSGEEAVELVSKQDYDLLILDMILPPGINGLETYKRILKLSPGQKAVIASGYSQSDDVSEALGLGAGSYIKKPYTLESIGLAVRAELDRS